MTKRKPADRSRKRETLDALMERISSIETDCRPGGRPMTGRAGREIVDMSVHSFIAACLREREAPCADTGSVQDWVADCIEVMLGEKNTHALSMREMANRIADAVNAEDISMEDRWALYELCFMLTTQLSGKEADGIKWSEQCARRGTPVEKEPRSLYKRAFSQLAGRNFFQRKDEAAGGRMTLAQALRRMDEERVKRRIPLLRRPFEDFAMCCIAARSRENPAGEEDTLGCMMEDHRFMEAARVYGGYEWSGREAVSDFARKITVEYMLRADGRTMPRYEMLQTYELCYEFINLMADEEHRRGHRSLMQIEGLPARYDIDLQMEELVRENIEAMEAMETMEETEGD